MSNVNAKQQQPTSPTPTIVFDKLTSLLEDYKQSKKIPNSNNAVSSPPSSLQSQCDVLSKSVSGETTTSKSCDGKIDLSQISKYLPADIAVQSSVVSELVQFFANAGRLDCISNIAPENSKLLEDSWRKPKGIVNNKYRQWFDIYRINADTRMTTTDWNDVFGSTNRSNGRCQICTPNTTTGQYADTWARASDIVRLKSLQVNLMINPVANLTGSDPPLMASELQLVECMVVVDQFAMLSNPAPDGFAQAVGLVDTTPPDYQSSASFNTIFTLAGNLITPPTQVYSYPVMMPNELTHNSRFHILAHKRFPINRNNNWLYDATNMKQIQMPGDPQFHSFEVDMKGILCPYANGTADDPYINNVYFLLWGNTATTVSQNLYANCHYGIRVFFEDVGNQ